MDVIHFIIYISTCFSLHSIYTMITNLREVIFMKKIEVPLRVKHTTNSHHYVDIGGHTKLAAFNICSPLYSVASETFSVVTLPLKHETNTHFYVDLGGHTKLVCKENRIKLLSIIQNQNKTYSDIA